MKIARTLLLASVATLALGIAPAGASAPERVTFTIPEFIDFDAGDQCAFPIRLHFIDNVGTATLFFNDAGDVVREIDSGHLSVVVSNEETGASVFYNISGPQLITYSSDGGQRIQFRGPGLFSLFPGDVNGPGLIRTVGNVLFTRDPSGAITSISPSGQVIDVCALLAA